MTCSSSYSFVLAELAMEPRAQDFGLGSITQLVLCTFDSKWARLFRCQNSYCILFPLNTTKQTNKQMTILAFWSFLIQKKALGPPWITEILKKTVPCRCWKQNTCSNPRANWYLQALACMIVKLKPVQKFLFGEAICNHDRNVMCFLSRTA